MEALRLRWARCSVPVAPGGLVSVLIPTFNRKELLLSRALPSVLAQTYTNLEIIVACHGCTDGTQAAVRALGDPRIRVLDVPRTQTYPPTAENHWLAGPVAPLNAALKAATGDWLARIDDDDEWYPDHIEHLLKFARRFNYEFVSSAYRKVEDGVDYIIRSDHGDPPIGGTQTWLWRSHLRFMKWNPDCWRKSWNRVNDTDLAERMRRAGARIGHSLKITAVIRPRPGEVIGSHAYLGNKAAVEKKYAF